MAAPTIQSVRSGVSFTPAAAASFQRAEADWGRLIDVNSTYRDWNAQWSMYIAWNAYVAGRGPYPGHSRALHPDLSKHCQGLALDSDDWATPGFNTLMAEHGWIRTAPNDPTERHHFEYQSWRDQHVGELAGAGGVVTTPEEDEEDMQARQVHWVRNSDKHTVRALVVPGTAYFMMWDEHPVATIANRFATNMRTGSSTPITESLARVMEREADAMLPKGVTVDRTITDIDQKALADAVAVAAADESDARERLRLGTE